MIDERILLVGGFLIGIGGLWMLLWWTYNHLRQIGMLGRRRKNQVWVLVGMMMLPLVLALVTLPGLIARLELNPPGRPGLELPQTGGEPLKTPLPPTATPTVSPLNEEQSEEMVAIPISSSATPDPASIITLPTVTPVTTPIFEGARPPGKIVYVCQIYHNAYRDQICMMYPDGSEQRRVSPNHLADYNFPTLSPDGGSLLYAGNETGVFHIYEMDLRTEEIRQLTGGQQDSLSPAVSPDGQRIVFTRKSGGRSTIWIMNRDGSDARRIFGNFEGEGWDPVWSPDGKRILFASNLASRIQLFTIDPDGSRLLQVTDLDYLRGRHDWSPDGRNLAVYQGIAWQREITLLRPDGSDPRPVTAGGNNLAPSFSPDGQWVTYVSYLDHGRDIHGCEIYVVRIDGSEMKRLTENDYCDWQPDWGP